MPQQAQHVAIVGGGITGLATAYYLQKAARAADLPLDYSLIEAAPQVGGKVVSEAIDGFVIEGGPDSFLTQKPWAWQLCQELGLGERLIGTNDERRQTYILHRGRLQTLPEGMRLIVPTKVGPFLRSPLLSPWGKLRALAERFLPPQPVEGDESMAALVSRRLGREVLDRIGEPLLAGIYVGDPQRLSIQSSFPRFPEMIKKHGSLTQGTLAQLAAATTPPKPMFMTLQGGLTELIETLVARLTGEIVTGQQVERLQVDREAEVPYRLHLSDGRQIQAHGVILTTPAPISAHLLRPHSPDLAQALGQIRYLSSATVALAFRKAEVNHLLNGFGFVVPKTEPCQLLACTWVSTKFDYRAPADGVLLRAFVGGYSQEALVDLPEDRLITLVRAELKRIMGIEARPIYERLYRWPQGNPQYDVGHLDRIAAIERTAQDRLPGLYLTGSAFYGVGLPDCIRQGQETAQKAIAHLKTRSRNPQPVEVKP